MRRVLPRSETLSTSVSYLRWRVLNVDDTEEKLFDIIRESPYLDISLPRFLPWQEG